MQEQGPEKFFVPKDITALRQSVKTRLMLALLHLARCPCLQQAVQPSDCTWWHAPRRARPGAKTLLHEPTWRQTPCPRKPLLLVPRTAPGVSQGQVSVAAQQILVEDQCCPNMSHWQGLCTTLWPTPWLPAGCPAPSLGMGWEEKPVAGWGPSLFGLCQAFYDFSLSCFCFRFPEPSCS